MAMFNNQMVIINHSWLCFILGISWVYPSLGWCPPQKKNRVGSWDVATPPNCSDQSRDDCPGCSSSGRTGSRIPTNGCNGCYWPISYSILPYITHIKTQTCTPSRGPIESPRVTCRFGTALWCIPHESCRICCVESMGSAWICCYGLGSYDPSYQSVIRCFFWVITQGGKSQHGGKCAWLRKWRGVQVETQRPS